MAGSSSEHGEGPTPSSAELSQQFYGQPTEVQQRSILADALRTGSSGRSYSPEQLFPLMRLSYVNRQRRESVNVLGNTDWRVRLLNKTMYSLYQDCVAAGVRGEAKLLIGAQEQRP